jgi:hypothetical protein
MALDQRRSILLYRLMINTECEVQTEFSRCSSYHCALKGEAPDSNADSGTLQLCKVTASARRPKLPAAVLWKRI